MTNNITKINFLLLKNLDVLVEKHFKVLGNCIGDYLMLIELLTTEKGRDIGFIHQLTTQYASKGDDILNIHKELLFTNLRSFIEALTLEITNV